MTQIDTLRPAAVPVSGQPSERTIAMWDGTELFYRAWLPATGPQARRAVFLFHRGHEHSGRFEDVAPELGLADAAVFAWDARGHGRSPGPRGYAPSFAVTVCDVDHFVRAICRAHGIALSDVAVLAHSVGAVAAAAWVHDYAPPVRAMVLVTPAFRVKLYVPLAIPALRLLRRLKGSRPSFVKSYVKAKMLTHDPEQARRYEADPLIARSIAVNILLDLHDTSTRLLADAGAIVAPTLLLAAGADWVVSLKAQRRFFDGLASDVKEMRTVPGAYHDLLHERDRAAVFAPIREFLARAFERSVDRSHLLEADRRGYTKDEHDRLRAPLPPLSPRRLCFAAQRRAMGTLGRTSEGIRLGWASGFSSGRMLDYVYENRPRGFTPLGRMIDRAYLNSIGWRGIRQRRMHLEQSLRWTIERLREAGRPVRIMDIAAGPGRYVLETMRRSAGVPEVPISALLRDVEPANVEAGRKFAAAMGLNGAAFERGDAFEAESLAAVAPAPTVSIVSGLYELFPQNERVLASLRGVARAMREGGYLIYTGQPWHPQLEMIARVLPGFDGRPWVMRRRTQAELDELVAAAGFEKLSTLIDAHGIFTVAIARIGDVHG